MWRGVPRGVVVLGLVSLCMDVSSESIHALLPLYLATGLGVSMFAIGMLEGAAEALALIVKVFSGAWSDAVRKRKPLVLAGYGLAALTKPIFALAPSFAWIAGARFADRGPNSRNDNSIFHNNTTDAFSDVVSGFSRTNLQADPRSRPRLR